MTEWIRWLPHDRIPYDHDTLREYVEAVKEYTAASRAYRELVHDWRVGESEERRVLRPIMFARLEKAMELQRRACLQHRLAQLKALGRNVSAKLILLWFVADLLELM